jgi:hypothetical protein
MFAFCFYSQVKQPVVCPNQHVFCKVCMDVWLARNAHCPACRIPINEENPYRAVLGNICIWLNDWINC